MNKSEACPNCLTRLHPLEVSDLYRGKKLDCRNCGHRLRAAATGAWTSVFAILAGSWPWLSSWFFQDASFVGQILIVLTVAVIIWVAPPGLVAGAPWVSIKADAPEGLLGVSRRRG